MADAASVLGSPIATVDTPGTAMIPLNDPGSSVNVSTPPPTDVQTVGTPGTAMVQQPTQWTPPQPGQIDTTPSPQPDAEIAAGAVHQNWLSRILDTVGTILGGDKTIVATKHPDGTVSVEHNPSTTGEKWGRIAQAALGGAARGMAVGQGPGGAGRAVAAGTLAGLAQPQQNLQQANQESASMNAQQLAAANHALLDQQRIAQVWENTVRPQEYARQQEQDDFNEAVKLRDMGAKLVASPKNRAELATYGAANPEAVSNHLGVDGGFTRVLSHADGTADIYSIPGAIANQLNPNDDSYTSKELDPDNPGKLIDTVHTFKGNTHTFGEIELAKKANDVQNENNVKTALELVKTPTTGEGATVAGTLAAGTPRGTALLQAGKTIAQQKAAQAAAGRTPAVVLTPGMTGTPGGGPAYQPGQNPVLDDTAEGLASGRYLQSTLPKRTGKGQPTPQEQNYAANLVSQQKYGLPYNPAIIDQENKFATAPKTQAYLEGIDRMTGAHGDPGQLNQLLTLAQAAGIGGNAPLNDVKQAIRTRLGSQAADNFATLLTETQSNLGTLIGNPLLGSGESDQKLRTAQGAFGQNPTLDSLRGQAATVTDVLTRARNNMAANNRYIQQRYGTRLSPPTTNMPVATGGAANTGQAARQPATTGYQQGINSAQFPIAQSADGKQRTQWNGTTWATLP